MFAGQGSGRGSEDFLFYPKWIVPGSAFMADLLAQRYYRTAQPSCVRASPAYAPDLAGVYQAFGNDELRLTDAGLYVPEGARTNKCTNYNANPTDLTGVFVQGAGTVELVDDSIELAAAGLSSPLVNGSVFKVTIPEFLSVVVSGEVGNTNAHTLSVYIRGSGTMRFRLVGASASLGYSPVPASYERLSSQEMPTGATQPFGIQAGAGGAVVYFILNQLEEASTASSPIVTAGSAATRAADTVTLAAPSGTFDLHILFDDATEEVIEGFQDGDALPLDLPQGKNIVKYWGFTA